MNLYSRLFLLLFLLSGLARAEETEESGASPLMSLDEAAEKVARDSNGKVMRATQEKQDDKDVYVIRVLTPDGRRVQHYKLDAASGEIVERPENRQQEK